MKWLNGKKTYLGMIAGGLLGILWTQGLVADQLASTIAMAITAWTGVAMTHKYAKDK